MRTVILVIILIAVCLGAGNYWFGVRTEKGYADFIQHLAERKSVKLVKQDYDRGILSSRARTAFDVTIGDQKYRVILIDRIVHGPVQTSRLIEGDFDFTPVLAHISNSVTVKTDEDNLVIRAIKNSLPIRYTTIVTLSGEMEIDFAIKPFSKTDEVTSQTIAFEGLSGVVTHNTDFTSGYATIIMPLFELSGPDGSFRVDKLSMDFTMEKPRTGIRTPLGSYNLALKELSGDDNDSTSFVLRDIEFTTRTFQKNGRLNHTQSGSIKHVLYGDRKFGPARYGFEIRKIDAKAWDKVEKILEGMESKGDQQESSKLTGTIVDLLPELLKHSPEIELSELSFNTKNGETMTWAKITIDGSDPEILGNIFALVGAVSVEMTSSIPGSDLEYLLEEAEKKKLIKEAEGTGKAPAPADLMLMARTNVAEQLQQLVEQEIFVVKEDRFTIDVAYIAGSLTVNGTEFPLPMLW